MVDDDEAVRQILKNMLERLEFEVAVAENGKKAIEMSKEASYDVILMDVQMPVMDGYHATEVIRSREEPQGDRVPIIAVTAHAFEGDEKHCLAAGMDVYISKPVNFARALQLIRELIERKEALSAA